MRTAIIVLILAGAFTVHGQVPLKQWDKDFGGGSPEGLTSLQQTADGGYILGGYSSSGISGDKTQASQGGDYWVVKIDANGNKQWDKTFGGSDFDFLNSLQQTADGGYILGGWSASGVSGDKTQPSQGFQDYWVVKIDANGNKQWDKDFGGSDKDYFSSLQQTADGGCILGGQSGSGISGDKTQPSQGSDDYWVVKIDASGNKQWDKTFGGSDFDRLNSLQQTADGGYILGGESGSGISGDKTQTSQGNWDYWVVKIDANGNKQWDKDFGGSDYDFFSSLQQTADGGYILGGFSYSGAGGDKSQVSQGSADYWVVKIDASGNKQWDKTLGGSSNDELNSLQQTANGGYILGGESASGISGDKTQDSQGNLDYWVVKLCPGGNTYYRDYDNDGFGDPNNSTQSCSRPAGYITNNTDCNDNNAAINPNTVWVSDKDNDGYYTGDPVTQCTSPGTGYVVKTNQQAGDCNDNDATINPATVWVLDNDKDGYYTGNPVIQCTSPGTGYVIKANQQPGDCDDNNASIKSNTVWVLDNDKDGYYTGNPVTQCTSPGTRYVIKTNQQAGDCNDSKASIHPSAKELLDGLDNDCDGQIDENYFFIAITNASCTEGNSGQKALTFFVASNTPCSRKITVNYATQNGAATAGSDYVAQTGTLTFNPGTWQKTISILINGDKTKEANETFKVVLSNPFNATLLNTAATGTILNDDNGNNVANRPIAESVIAVETPAVKVFPNPAFNQVYITLEGYTGNITMQLATVEGKIVKQKKLQALAKFAQQQINVADLTAGIYFLTINDDKGNRQTEKVVISR